MKLSDTVLLLLLIISISGALSFFICQQRELKRNPDGRTFGFWSETGYMLLFVFAGEAFAHFFLTEAWMAVSVGFIMLPLTIAGGVNRLRSRKSDADDKIYTRRTLFNYLGMSISLGLGICAVLVWQLQRFARL